MWILVVFLFSFFALCLLAGTVKIEKARIVLLILGWAIWGVAWFLAKGNDTVSRAIFPCGFFGLAISHLIPTLIMRRLVSPPCVRVKRPGQGRFEMISCVTTISLLAIACLSYLAVTGSLRYFGGMPGYGLWTLCLAIMALNTLYYCRIEICGNGFWQGGGGPPRLNSWEEYESFCWRGEAKGGVELKLVSKPGFWPTTLLVVPHEDREAVQQILEANLPDKSSGAHDGK